MEIQDDVTAIPPEEQGSDKPEPETAAKAEVNPAMEVVPASEATPVAEPAPAVDAAPAADPSLPVPAPGGPRRPALYLLRPPGLRPRGVTRPRRRRGAGHNLAAPDTTPRPKPRAPRDRGPR